MPTPPEQVEIDAILAEIEAGSRPVAQTPTLELLERALLDPPCGEPNRWGAGGGF
jgi:hypothetical protein